MRNARQAQRGLSIIEVLVALTVMVIATTIALLVYDASRKSFKKGENLSEQQQGTRIAFDQLVSDLRLAGYNYNPDGDGVRPDEQIEGAYDTAIVFRADFDAQDPTASANPEAALAAGTYLTVSIGNDEIVAYVLAKPDGSSGDTLSFDADVKDRPRDAAVETVNIPNVALVHDDPPYTLYRITLNNDETTWGGSSFFTRTPLIDNVQSMSFRYFSQLGAQLNSTFDLTSTADDIGGADGGVAQTQRDSIRRVALDLVGLTRDPDIDWVDPDDSDPDTNRLRKFQLTSDVKPRNLGMVGIQDLAADVIPPSPPTGLTLVPGHCGGIYMYWNANPAADLVTSYRINYGTASGSYSGQRTVGTLSYYLPGLGDGVTYYVALQAADAAGNLSPMGTEVATTTSNLNTPAEPLNLTATDNLNGGVRLEWDAVTTNTTNDPAGDPEVPNIRDLAGYRVYRSDTPGFGSSTLIADENLVQNKTSPDFIDGEVVNCRPYYYKVSAVDVCGQESTLGTAVPGNAVSTNHPRRPINVQAFFSGLGQTKITWNPVTEDTTGARIFVDTYNVWRSTLIPDGTMPTDASGFLLLSQVVGAEEYLDNAVIPFGYSYWYAVSALDDCPNESVRSRPKKPECAFSGDVVFLNPADGAPVAGVVPVTVNVVAGTDTYDELELVFYHIGKGKKEHDKTIDIKGTPGPWTYNWLADPPGPYAITATVTNSLGCAKSTTIKVSAGFSVGCCLSPPDPDLDPIILSCTGPGGPKVECKEVTYEMINNNCLTAVAIEEIDIQWVDVVDNKPKLTGVRFDNTLIWNVTPPSASPAVNVFNPPKPSIDVSRDSTNPVDVTYVFDQVMSQKKDRDTLTTSYSFRLLDEFGQETSITGVCGPSTGMFNNMIVELHNN